MRNEVLQIMINREPGVPMPKIAYHGTSAGFDVGSKEQVTIPANGELEIHTGLRITIPDCEPYYMLVLPRSGFGFKNNIRLHLGLIDSGYTGEILIKAYNLTDTDFTIEENQPFAQIIVVEKPRYKFKDLTAEQFALFAQTQNRQDSGFGSSNRADRTEFQHDLDKIKADLFVQGYVLGLTPDEMQPKEPDCEIPEELEEETAENIEPKKITIFGRYNCPYCVKAKELATTEFVKRGYTVEFIETDKKGITKEDLSNLVGKEVRTVPQIFIGAEHIGGCDDFFAYYEANVKDVEPVEEVETEEND